MKRGDFSGIMVIEKQLEEVDEIDGKQGYSEQSYKEPNGEIVGTIVNEFGVKVLDFTLKGGKAQIFNLIKPLDKWYIRKMLRRDFKIILSNIFNPKNFIEKKMECVVQDENEIKFINHRLAIEYIFTPIE